MLSTYAIDTNTCARLATQLVITTITPGAELTCQSAKSLCRRRRNLCKFVWCWAESQTNNYLLWITHQIEQFPYLLFQSLSLWKTMAFFFTSTWGWRLQQSGTRRSCYIALLLLLNIVCISQLFMLNFPETMIQLPHTSSGIRRSHSVESQKFFKSKFLQCSPKDWPDPSKCWSCFFIIFSQLKTTSTLKIRQVFLRLKSKGFFGGLHSSV